MSVEFWSAVAAMKTFNTSEGRKLQLEARKKLSKLPKSMPLDLLEKLYTFYLKEAPYDLWVKLEGTHPEHAPTLVRLIARNESVQARFLTAAYAEDPERGLQRAGRLLALIHKTTNLPACWKSLGKQWHKLEGEALAKPATTALAGHKGVPGLTETLGFFGLVYVLAKVDPKAPVLDTLAKDSTTWGVFSDSVGRAVAAAAKP